MRNTVFAKCNRCQSLRFARCCSWRSSAQADSVVRIVPHCPAPLPAPRTRTPQTHPANANGYSTTNSAQQPLLCARRCGSERVRNQAQSGGGQVPCRPSRCDAGLLREAEDNCGVEGAYKRSRLVSNLSSLLRRTTPRHAAPRHATASLPQQRLVADLDMRGGATPTSGIVPARCLCYATPLWLQNGSIPWHSGCRQRWVECRVG